MLIYIIIGIIIIITIFTIIEYKIKYKDDEEEELTEHEKTMKAIRILVYIVIALIISGIAIKLLMIYGILSFNK